MTKSTRLAEPGYARPSLRRGWKAVTANGPHGLEAGSGGTTERSSRHRRAVQGGPEARLARHSACEGGNLRGIALEIS